MPSRLSFRERSPLARRILTFMKDQDPPWLQVDLIQLFYERYGVKLARQTVNNWLWSHQMPGEENIPRLAVLLHCTEDEIRRDIEQSRNWRAPVRIEQWVNEIKELARREKWRDRDAIMPLLERLLEVIRQAGSDSILANMVRDTLTLSLKPHEMAQRIAWLVQAQDRADPDDDDPPVASRYVSEP